MLVRQNRGVALATSLMLAVLILVLGLAVLGDSQRDLYFQRQQDARDKAELLARSGLEHCLFLLNQTPPALDTTLTVNTPITYDVLPPTETIEVEKRQDTGTGRFALVVRGVVRKTNGELLAKRTLIVPYGPDFVITETEFATQAFQQEL